MLPLIRSLRPRQWTKNLLVFAGLVFSGQAFGGAEGGQEPLLAAGLVFAAFCAASSAVYLLNDVVDRERDRQHPVKRFRPIAAGELQPGTAMAAAGALAVVAAALSGILALSFGAAAAAWSLGGYLLLQLAYSLHLKHVVLLDVFSIAAGFLLRVLAGVWAVGVGVSPWLVACTVQLALFLALCKRKAELVALDRARADGQAPAQRPLLAQYDGPGLDVMVALMASATVVTYGLYTLLPGALLSLDVPIESQAGRPGMIWTLPFVLYGVLRYLHLVFQCERGERPERVLIEDKPLAASILGYMAVVGAVLYL
jgi:4-hydroxybenzoate polyprenyltransferase